MQTPPMSVRLTVHVCITEFVTSFFLRIVEPPIVLLDVEHWSESE